MQTIGTYDIEFSLGADTLVAPFIVSKDLNCEGIMGMNIIRPYGLVLDAQMGQLLRLDDPARKKLGIDTLPEATSKRARHVNFIAEEHKWSGVLEGAEQTTVEPGQARLVKCRVRTKDGQPVANAPVICYVAALALRLDTNEHGQAKIYIPNAGMERMTIMRGEQLGTAESSFAAAGYTGEEVMEKLEAMDGTASQTAALSNNEEGTMVTQHVDTKTPLDDKLVEDAIDKSASKEAKTEIKNMLKEFQDVVSRDQHDLGRSDAVIHDIELEDQRPVYTQQYRLPIDQLDLVKDHLAAWLRAGIVEPTKSKYNSPVFCVPKKETGKLRVVLDYRKLNQKCMPDKYSIRPVEQCIAEVGQANSKIFSCIDLRSGFWQLDLDKKARHLTAFTIPGVGQFQYTVAPMGLAGSPASFSRLMDLIMKDLSNVITYIDDCLVHSPDETTHAQHVRMALQRIRKHKLKINLEKCVFMAKEVQYLGHTLSGEGIRPGKDKTQAIKEAKPPANVKQVRSFMGLANYFRSFIPGFAVKAAPMFALTRADSQWEGGELPPAALRTFEFLRQAIISEPILRFHSRTGKYHLFTDAAQGDEENEGGLGAVLMQEDERGQKRPVGYASRRLQKHEKNYPAFLLEMQAAVFGMEYFETHLQGRRFALYTDHKPLCRLSTTHTKTLNRLQLKMTELNPQLRFIAGNENTIADFLSRYQGIGKTPTTKTEAEFSHSEQGVVAAKIDTSPFRLATLQDRDPTLNRIKEALKAMDCYDKEKKETPNRPIKVDGNTNKWRIVNDVLMVYRGKGTNGKLQQPQYRTAVPESMWKEFMQEAHNSLLTGHAGAYKTEQRIAHTFWWPYMSKHIAEHISKCATCQETTDKGKPLPPKRQPLPIPSGPSWRIHIDLFGPNKCEDGKKRYVAVMTDAFTKLVALRVIDDKKATTVAKAILDGWCYVYGIPHRIHTDQGLEFNNDLARALWTSLQIEHSTTTPYHPQCNAHAEVFNRTMKNYLAAMLRDAQKSTLEWRLYIAPLAFSYNTSIHKASKESPFMTTFGYDPRIPLWDQPVDQGEEIDKPDQADAFYAHKRAQTATRKIALNNMQHMQEETARTVDRNIPHSDISYTAGEAVWVKIAQTTEPNKKLAAKWEPGTVVERTGFNTYRIRREARSRKKMATLNAQRLKPRKTTEDGVDIDPEGEAEQEEEEEGPADTAPVQLLQLPNGQIMDWQNVSPDDIRTLLHQGYALTGHQCGTRTHPPAQQQQPQQQQPQAGPSVPDLSRNFRVHTLPKGPERAIHLYIPPPPVPRPAPPIPPTQGASGHNTTWKDGNFKRNSRIMRSMKIAKRTFLTPFAPGIKRKSSKRRAPAPPEQPRPAVRQHESELNDSVPGGPPHEDENEQQQQLYQQQRQQYEEQLRLHEFQQATYCNPDPEIAQKAWEQLQETHRAELERQYEAQYRIMQEQEQANSQAARGAAENERAGAWAMREQDHASSFETTQDTIPSQEADSSAYSNPQEFSIPDLSLSRGAETSAQSDWNMSPIAEENSWEVRQHDESMRDAQNPPPTPANTSSAWNIIPRAMGRLGDFLSPGIRDHAPSNSGAAAQQDHNGPITRGANVWSGSAGRR
jgi:transposase InsO family protein/ribonuclease HI